MDFTKSCFRTATQVSSPYVVFQGLSQKTETYPTVALEAPWKDTGGNQGREKAAVGLTSRCTVRYYYPWISEECYGVIDGERRVTIKRNWAHCPTAGACAAEEASQSADSGRAGQLWLRGEACGGEPPLCFSSRFTSSQFSVSKVRIKIHFFSRKWNHEWLCYLIKANIIAVVYRMSCTICMSS